MSILILGYRKVNYKWNNEYRWVGEERVKTKPDQKVRYSPYFQTTLGTDNAGNVHFDDGARSRTHTESRARMLAFLQDPLSGFSLTKNRKIIGQFYFLKNLDKGSWRLCAMPYHHDELSKDKAFIPATEIFRVSGAELMDIMYEEDANKEFAKRVRGL